MTERLTHQDRVAVTPQEREYDQLIEAMAQALEPDEYWCVYHPDGALEEAASKDMGKTVRVTVEALGGDWDDLKEQGYYLGRIRLPFPPDLEMTNRGTE